MLGKERKRENHDGIKLKENVGVKPFLLKEIQSGEANVLTLFQVPLSP